MRPAAGWEFRPAGPAITAILQCDQSQIVRKVGVLHVFGTPGEFYPGVEMLLTMATRLRELQGTDPVDRRRRAFKVIQIDDESGRIVAMTHRILK